MSVCPSVCVYVHANEQLGSQLKFDSWEFFENMLRKFDFPSNLTIMTGTLHEEQFTFMISRQILLKIRHF